MEMGCFGLLLLLFGAMITWAGPLALILQLVSSNGHVSFAAFWITAAIYTPLWLWVVSIVRSKS
jgi:hypothetical protein